SSNVALARALVTYNMMIEGVLAETGYYSYGKQLERGRLFPGLARALRLISRDESRHIRFGVYMLQLLISEDARMWEVVQGRMQELLPLVLGVVGPAPDDPPLPNDSVFAASPDEMVGFATAQYARRVKVLERARGQARRDLEREVGEELTEEFFAGPVVHWRIPYRAIRGTRWQDLRLNLLASHRLPGFALFGVMYGGDVGVVRMCASRSLHHILLIETDHGLYGVTPADAEGFLAALQARIRG